LTAAGYHPERGLKLYLWNAKVGEAFHMPIQAVEVGLRNRINLSLKQLYGDDWCKNLGFLAIIDQDRHGDLDVVLRRIHHRGLKPGNGQIVAGLSFGFWVGLLQARYNPPMWGSHLRVSFPDLPKDRSRKSLAAKAGEIATFRNRISHHEPIFKRDLSKDYQSTMEFLTWISPSKAEWIRPHCRVPEVLRQKP